MSTPDQLVVLVSGANKGIGLEAVRLLSEQLPHATILLGTRSTANGEAALTKLRQQAKPSAYSNVQPIALDVTDKASIAAAVQEVKTKHGRLDVLLNNSGIASVDGQQVHQGILDVNLYGVRDTIDAFLPLLPPSSLLVTVSSEVGAWTTYDSKPDLQHTLLNPATLTWPTLDTLARESVTTSKPGTPSSPWPALFATYGLSKALVSAYMRTVALQHPQLKVAVVCPGYCATDINHNSGPRTAAQGGESVIFPITHAFDSGRFYQDGKELEYSYPTPAWVKEQMANMPQPQRSSRAEEED